MPTLNSESEIKYEHKVLAYIDLLGWRDLVKETQDKPSKLQELARTLALLHNLAANAGSYQKTDQTPCINTQVFSDLIVLTSQIEDLKTLATEVILLTQNLLMRGFPCRGAIVEGNIYHNGSVILGPALVKAYEIESKVAKYPRIIVAENLANTLSEINLVQKDHDGIYHLDYLSPGNPINRLALLKCGQKIEELRRKFSIENTDNTEPKTLDILMKLNWLQGYYNAVNDHHKSRLIISNS